MQKTLINRKVLITIVSLSFTNICISSQGKNEHVFVENDKFALNPYVKTRLAFTWHENKAGL